MSNWKQFILKSTAMASAALLFGFLVFAALTTRPTTTRSSHTDGIVVLTGGVQRIKMAGELLQSRLAKRLLISGVNRIVSRTELRRILDIDSDLFVCCVDIDYAAQNTRGNAIETQKWVRKHGFRSLTVVTASYHMPRSLTELGHLMPTVDLVAHPVLPPRFRDAPWWLDHENAMLLGAEYMKYLPSAAQFGIGRMLETPPGQPDKLDVNEQRAVAVQ